MPILDHFHPPLARQRLWHAFRNAWAATMARHLNRFILPEAYFAAPNVQFGARLEIALGTFATSPAPYDAVDSPVALSAPPEPATLTVPAIFPDTIEVLIVQQEGGPQLVAAVELVSPSNKDRPQSHLAFAAKMATYLHQGIALAVIDLVTSRAANLHNAWIALLGLSTGHMPEQRDSPCRSGFSPTGAGVPRSTEIRGGLPGTYQKGGEGMSPAAIVTEAQPLILHLGAFLDKMSEHEFFAFCQLNPDWRMERTSTGDLVIMPPTDGWTGARNFTLIGLFSRWVEADGTGLGFDSSTGFTLPNGAKRSPDLAWVRRSRWEALSIAEQEEFPPLRPDFVVELRSCSDALATLQAKMQEYMANGAQLGWLIDPHERKVYVYRPEAEVCCLENPITLSGEPLLPGFTCHVQRLWS